MFPDGSAVIARPSAKPAGASTWSSVVDHKPFAAENCRVNQRSVVTRELPVTCTSPFGATVTARAQACPPAYPPGNVKRSTVVQLVPPDAPLRTTQFTFVSPETIEIAAPAT